MEEKKIKRAFLGGTCNGSTWRDELIPLLSIDYFNPVVKDWTPECQAEEIKQREECDYCLYVITPRMTGFYSIAEVVDDSNKRPKKTIFCVIGEDRDKETGEYFHFISHQAKSLIATKDLVSTNGGTVCNSLQEIADFVNQKPVFN